MAQKVIRLHGNKFSDRLYLWRGLIRVGARQTTSCWLVAARCVTRCIVSSNFCDVRAPVEKMLHCFLAGNGAGQWRMAASSAHLSPMGRWFGTQASTIAIICNTARSVACRAIAIRRSSVTTRARSTSPAINMAIWSDFVIFGCIMAGQRWLSGSNGIRLFKSGSA